MDCRTCVHNAYQKNTDWVMCAHPVTVAKNVQWQKGDPAWVSMLTADVPISRISELADCPTWEKA